MGDSDHFDALETMAINNEIRKATEEEAPCTMDVFWPPFRRSGDHLDGAIFLF